MPGDAEALQQGTVVGAEVHHEGTGGFMDAIEIDAQTLAHGAAAAVAASQVDGAHLAGGAGFAIHQRGGDPIRILREGFDLPAEPGFDQFARIGSGFEGRLDDDLTDAHGCFSGEATVVLATAKGRALGAGRIGKACQLMASKAADPGDVEGVVDRHTHLTQRVGNTQGPIDLHAATIGQIHLGMACRRRIPFGDDAAHTVACQHQ